MIFYAEEYRKSLSINLLMLDDFIYCCYIATMLAITLPQFLRELHEQQDLDCCNQKKRRNINYVVSDDTYTSIIILRTAVVFFMFNAF